MSGNSLLPRRYRAWKRVGRCSSREMSAKMIGRVVAYLLDPDNLEAALVRPENETSVGWSILLPPGVGWDIMGYESYPLHY